MELGLTCREAETTFDMQIPNNELGVSAYRQYEYAQRRPNVWAAVLVSCWGEQRKLLGFRLNTERDWHVAPGSSHWCGDCVATCCSCGMRSV